MVQQQTIDDKEFRPIDREATVQAVKSFFSEQECDYSYNYQELKRLSGAWGELKSPSLNTTGGSATGGVENTIERRFIKHTECLKAIQAVEYAIHGCDRVSREILMKRYIEQRPVKIVRDILQIAGNATWHRLDQRACCQFAECMEAATILYRTDQRLFPQLQFYL